MSALVGRAVRAVASQWRALLLLVALIGIWELYVDLGGADPLILPAPHAVASSLYDDRALLWSNFLVTAEEVVLGMIVAAIAALAFASVMHFSTTVRRAVYPLLIASQTIPIPMLAPVLVFWLGFGILPKLIVIALVSFFSIVITTLARVRLSRSAAVEVGADVRHVPATERSCRSSCRPLCRACSPAPRSR